MIEYPDGNKFQIIALSFEAEVVGGKLGLSNETTDFGYFTVAEMEKMDMLPGHLERILDALDNFPAAYIR